ncbi:MAG: translation initiation factor IF-2 [Dehalococcoidia bacterium]
MTNLRTPPTPTSARPVEIPAALSVRDLAELLSLPPVEVIKGLMKNGVMAALTQVIDYDTAAIIASDYGFDPHESAPAAEEVVLAPETASFRRLIEDEDPANLEPRPPVVTVMGHVDHGKTSLLDAIRRTNVTASEAGGITQHIGAYQVTVRHPSTGEERPVTFLDTPGHEAFTAMRARGAQATDIAVLVVAADDGVMPQTREAIAHAKAAGVPIVVALNKIDLANANPDRVKSDLLQNDVVIEEYGGDTICVPVSARTGAGLNDLLENLLLQADVLDLKANPNRSAVGIVIEAQMDRARGAVATVLVQAGTLHPGDVVVAGDAFGRIKAMFDDLGRRLKSAGPSTPARILGLNAVPHAGDVVTIARDEKVARAAITQRQRLRDAERAALARPVTLDTLYGAISAGKIKELNIILKADVQGSLEPIRTSLERLSNEQVRVRIIHSGVGSVTESDVMLAAASKGIIIGFNNRIEPGALRVMAQEGVDVRQYNIIYNVVEDVEKALKGMLAPVFVEVIDGHAEVRQIIRISRFGNIAGSYVTDGKVVRNSTARVKRGAEVLHTGRVANLKRMKDDVREVDTGYECGITLEDFDAFQIGDVIEFFHSERQAQ